MAAFLQSALAFTLIVIAILHVLAVRDEQAPASPGRAAPRSGAQVDELKP